MSDIIEIASAKHPMEANSKVKFGKTIVESVPWALRKGKQQLTEGGIWKFCVSSGRTHRFKFNYSISQR